MKKEKVRVGKRVERNWFWVMTVVQKQRASANADGMFGYIN